MPDINIQTYGWDLIYISSIAKANEAIANLGTGPDTFSQTSTFAQDRTSSITLGLDGHFGPWQFYVGTRANPCPGGPFAWLKIPIKSGQLKKYMSADKDAAVAEQWDITGASLVAQCCLEMFDVGNPPFKNDAATGGAWRNMGLNAPKDGQANQYVNPASKLPYWEVLRSDSTWANLASFANLSPQDLQAYAGDANGLGWCDQLMQYWLQDPANKAAIAQVFSTFNIQAELAEDGPAGPDGAKALAWMSPYEVDYAIGIVNDDNENPDPAKSMLAATAMASGRSGNYNDGQVDSRILSVVPNSDSALVISPEMFCRHFLKPSLQATASDGFDPSSAPEWSVTNDNMAVTNVQSLQLGKLKKGDGSFATATVAKGDYTLRLGEKSVELSITGLSWNYDDEHTVFVDYKTDYTFSLGEDKKSWVVTPGNETIVMNVETEYKSNLIAQIMTDVAIGALGGFIGAGIGVAAEAIAATDTFQSLCRSFTQATGITGTGFRYTAQPLTIIDEAGSPIRIIYQDGQTFFLRGQVEGFAKTTAKYVADGVLAAVDWANTKFGSVAEIFQTSKAKIIGGLIGAVTATSVKAAVDNAKLTEAGVKKDLGKLTDFTPTVAVGMSFVTWPDASPGHEGFEMHEIHLDGALVIGGKLTKA